MEELLREKRKKIGLDFQRLSFSKYQRFIPMLITDVLNEDVVIEKKLDFQKATFADPSRHLRLLWSIAAF